MGDNGLPIDGIATISGSYVFIEDLVNPLEYTPGSSTVTLPVGSDLTPVTTAKARYTGRYVLLTNDGQILYINRQSINVAARSFTISRSDSSQITPVAIDLTPGWKVAEADIVNRMATTAAAKIDTVEFRDMQFQLELDGDPVSILDSGGNKIDPATEQTQLANNNELKQINDELDTQTILLAQLDDNISNQYVSNPTILNTSISIANQEYTVTLPASVRRFTLKSRQPSSLEYRYLSEGPHLTLKPGSLIKEENIVRETNLVIYIKSNKPNTVIEAAYWE